MKIPKIIHQTYSTKNVPAAIADNIAYLKRNNPDYEYRLYDDHDIDNFILENYPKNIVQAYRQIDPSYGAARADFFRYLLIYKVGGVYIDIKSSLDKPLSLTIRPEDSYILSQWNRTEGRESWGVHEDLRHIVGGEFQQWHVIAEPGHPFLAAVIKAVLSNIHAYRPWKNGFGWHATLKTTGPILYTKTIYPILDTEDHRFLSGENEIGLVYSIFDGGTTHKSLSKVHYIENTACLVKGSGLNRILFSAYMIRENRRRRKR